MPKSRRERSDQRKIEPTRARIVHPELTDEDPVFYSNSVLVNHTPWDFTLHFGHLVTPGKAPTRGPEVEVTARRVATLTIPRSLMPALIRALQENLSRSEDTYGKIQTPETGEENE